MAWCGGKKIQKRENKDLLLLLKSDDAVDKSIISPTCRITILPPHRAVKREHANVFKNLNAVVCTSDNDGQL